MYFNVALSTTVQYFYRQRFVRKLLDSFFCKSYQYINILNFFFILSNLHYTFHLLRRRAEAELCNPGRHDLDHNDSRFWETAGSESPNNICVHLWQTLGKVTITLHLSEPERDQKTQQRSSNGVELFEKTYTLKHTQTNVHSMLSFNPHFLGLSLKKIPQKF